jgi:hypothetical protein
MEGGKKEKENQLEALIHVVDLPTSVHGELPEVGFAVQNRPRTVFLLLVQFVPKEPQLA